MEDEQQQAALAVMRAAASWQLADYGLSVLVFSTLSVTWWRGAWNLLAASPPVLPLLPDHRPSRLALLIAVGFVANLGGFASYGPLRAWSRTLTSFGSSRVESLGFGLVKRLVVLVRCLGSAASWVGWWSLIDNHFCSSSGTDCAFR